MASSGGSNQQAQGLGGGFDMNKLFNPSSSPMNMSMMMSGPPTSTPSNLISSPSFPTPSLAGNNLLPPYLTPSSSYPPPSGPYPFHHHPQYYPYPPPQYHQDIMQQQQQSGSPISYSSTPPPVAAAVTSSNIPSSGSDLLLSFFGNQSQSSSNLYPTPSSSEFSPSAPPISLATQNSSPMRLLSNKLPKGRHLIGNHVAYDIDVRLPGEGQPQLEVTPITKYASDPDLLLGRQIAVNRNYICYGLKLGAIRILNIITAMRSLLRGHTQRVTDMTFFADDVHLLASASIDGRVFIWKINEGPDEEDKPQIFGKVVLAIQIVEQGKSIHPRLCWHPHKQEILMVAIGNHILKIDRTKVGKGEQFSAEKPLMCSIDKLVDGVQHFGKHDDEITDLSMCQWMNTRLASASKDGTVKIWKDRNPTPLAVLRPHGGHPVNAVTFLTAPHRPDHIILITGGPLNREVKVWASASDEGWLLPGDAESWCCTQTLELRTSESKIEDIFFNQAVALPGAGLYLLANAKKNAIYVIHIDYGPCPDATRMDYIAEFSVAMPILSLTGTSEGLRGEHTVQVYCVQTQAIQQYALDLSRCLPPPLEMERMESNVTCTSNAANSNSYVALESPHGSNSSDIVTKSVVHSVSSRFESAPVCSWPEQQASSEITSLHEIAKSTSVPLHGSGENIQCALPPLPLSPRLSKKLSGLRSLSNRSEHPPLADHGFEQAVRDIDHRMEIPKEDNDDLLSSCENDLVFKHPTHLVTPSEILRTTLPPDENFQINQCTNVGPSKVQDMIVNINAESTEVEVKVVSDTGSGQTKEFDYPRDIAEKKEQSFYSQSSDLGIQMGRDFCVESFTVEGTQLASDVSFKEVTYRPSNTTEEVKEYTMNEEPMKADKSQTHVVVQQSSTLSTKGKKSKGKYSQVSAPSSLSPSPFNLTDLSNGSGCGSVLPSTDATLSQLLSMQNMLDQLLSSQKEMQKQINTVVSVPVNKEGKRLEASLGRNIEKVVRANIDALWARFLEENVKHEKLERDRSQNVTNLITNFINKDLPAMFEKTLKKEVAAVGAAVARAITPTLEKYVSSAIAECFQKGVGDKAVNQLDKSVSSKLESIVARQIQGQFQTSGKQALQDALRSTLEGSIIPAFEMSCKAMFDQVDVTFQKGLSKHATSAQQQFEIAHSPLSIALRDAINSASSITRTLSEELADGQRKLLAIAAAGANSEVGKSSSVTQPSKGPLAAINEMAEAPLDPTKELLRLVAERKYDEAFTVALHRSDVSIVSWLCSQVDLSEILSMNPCPLNQGVLLALIQQLACDISKNTSRKLTWMRDVAIALNPTDPLITVHTRPVFEQVYQILGHQLNLSTTSGSESSSIRLLMHVINSVLMSCK